MLRQPEGKGNDKSNHRQRPARLLGVVLERAQETSGTTKRVRLPRSPTMRDCSSRMIVALLSLLRMYMKQPVTVVHGCPGELTR